MTTFKITILGCSAAIPAHGRFLSAQALQVRERLYLIDCGEGTQMRMSDFNIRRSKINQIFISHLHGDHCFGLPGLLTSFSLMGRKEQLDIFSPAGLETGILSQLEMSGAMLSFPIQFHSVDTTKQKVIFEDEVVRVSSLPLKHRVPTTGFLFREKELPRNMIPEKIAELNIPCTAIPAIKKGADFKMPDGRLIPNALLTHDPPRPKSYAYCSDTAYHEPLAGMIRGVDMLYHETTFLDESAEDAKISMHSTALEAARIALLAGAGRLLTGHYSARYRDANVLVSEAQTIFPMTEVVYDGAVFEC